MVIYFIPAVCIKWSRLLRNLLQKKYLHNPTFVYAAFFPQHDDILPPGCCTLFCMLQELHHGLLLDKQIPAPSPFLVKLFNTLSFLSSLQSLPAACIGLGLYQSSYWSQMKHWTHQYSLNASLLFNHLPFKSPGWSPTSHPLSVIRCASHKFALSFWEEYVIIINIFQHSLCQAQSGWEIFLFFLSPLLPFISCWK